MFSFDAQIPWPLIKEIYASVTSLQVATMYGIVMGFSSYLLPQLMEADNDLTLSPWMVWLIGSSSIMLKVLGALIDTMVSDFLGRKRVLQICFGCLIICWIVIACSFNGVMLLVARLFTSIFTGMFISCAVYTIEISNDKTRSNYLCLIPLCVTIGTEFAYVATYLLNWRMASLVIAAYSFVVFTSLCIVPESPYWYLMHDRREQAYQSLEWFLDERTTMTTRNEQIEKRLDDLQRSIDRKPPTFRNKLNLMFDREMARKFSATFLLLIMLSFTGYLTMNNWIVQIFGSVQSVFDDRVLGIVFGIVLFICNIVLIAVIGKVNRKRLIVTAYIGMAVTGFMLALCRFMSSYDVPSVGISYLSTATVFVYTVFLHTGGASPLWITFTEISPTIIKSTMIGIINIVSVILEAVVVYLLPYVIYGHHLLPLFCFLFILSSVMGLITFFFLPDTTTTTSTNSG